MGDWRLRLHEAGGASCLKGGKRRRTYLAIRKLSSISHGMHLYVRSSNLGPLDSTRVRFICLPHCTVGDLTQLQGMPIPRISEFYGLACQWRADFLSLRTPAVRLHHTARSVRSPGCRQSEFRARYRPDPFRSSLGLRRSVLRESCGCCAEAIPLQNCSKDLSIAFSLSIVPQ